MLKEGVVLGKRYEILERIGAGGMADVYKGKDHKLNRYIAVKVLKSDYRNDQVFIQKFLSEAQAAAGLLHPNVVNVYDVGQDRGLYYMVMELVEGITLKDYIEKKGQLSVKETISISIQMVTGIQGAHNQHIIHRDIKPQNIMISKDGKVKVTDFGIARATTSTKTISTNVMGSVHYTSPEQARGGIVDERSDIYSAGITMYEMITGHVPFDGDSTVTVAIKHLKEEMPLPSEEVPDIPYSLECIILKCTQKDPAKRYQNCQELITDLKRSLVDPDGHFVTGVAAGEADETVLMTTEEMQRIADDDYPQEEEYSDSDYQNEYDDDDEDDEDDEEDYSRNRKNGGRSQERNKEQVNPNTKKIMKILMVVVIAVIAIGIIVVAGNAAGIFKVGPGTSETDTESKVIVPSIVGMSEEDAKDALNRKELGYYVEAREASDKFDAGEIISQDPAANEKVDKNTEVRVVVSTGKEVQNVKVPDVVGKGEDEAQEMIEDAGLIVSVESAYDDNVESGKVISSNPSSGVELKEGSTVTIVVSKGAEKVSIPNVVGSSQADAEAAITGQGLSVGSVSEEYSDEYSAGVVIAQNPTAQDAKVSKGTSVNLTVSKGPKTEYVSVPSLSGKTQSQAEQALRDAGLEPGNVHQEYSSSVAAGYVISQTANPGSQMEKGGYVDFTISLGAQPSQPSQPSEPSDTEDTDNTAEGQ